LGYMTSKGPFQPKAFCDLQTLITDDLGVSSTFTYFKKH